MPLWHEANYIFLTTSYFFWLSSSSHIPHHQIIDAETPQRRETQLGSSRMMDILTDKSLNRTQQENWHQDVHRTSANAATPPTS